MSKYTDMLADKYRCHCGTCEVQKGNVGDEECKICSHYAIREALQIADRLEQAIIDEQTADCIIVDTKCVNNKHDKEVWLNGYNQALSDLRGDKDGIEMRDATNQEKESVSAYIKSISEDTGFNFFR